MYVKFWRKVFELCGDDPLVEILLHDFEKAAYQAAVQTHPAFLEVGGCFFHFRQAVHKHVQEYGVGLLCNA